MPGTYSPIGKRGNFQNGKGRGAEREKIEPRSVGGAKKA